MVTYQCGLTVTNKTLVELACLAFDWFLRRAELYCLLERLIQVDLIIGGDGLICGHLCQALCCHLLRIATTEI